ARVTRTACPSRLASSTKRHSGASVSTYVADGARPKWIGTTMCAPSSRAACSATSGVIAYGTVVEGTRSVCAKPLIGRKRDVERTVGAADAPPVAVPDRVAAVDEAAAGGAHDPGHLRVAEAVGGGNRNDEEVVPVEAARRERLPHRERRDRQPLGGDARRHRRLGEDGAVVAQRLAQRDRIEVVRMEVG